MFAYGADKSAPYCPIRGEGSDRNGVINRGMGGFCLFYTALFESGTTYISLSHAIGVPGDSISYL